MTLQNAYYIIAIIFMTLMLVLIFTLLAAVLVIKAKINKVHDAIDGKIGQVKSVAEKTIVGLKALGYFMKK